MSQKNITILAVLGWLIVSVSGESATFDLGAANSQKYDAGLFVGGARLSISATGIVAIAPGFLTYPDGSLAAPVPPPFAHYSYANPGASGYPTTFDGDGTNHFPGGGLNYAANEDPSFRWPVAGRQTTDTTDSATIRFGAVVGTFKDTPVRQNWFTVGYGTTVTVPHGGAHLYLLINESSYVDNQQAYSVTVDVVAEPSENLLTNGDFEEGNTGFTSDYAFGRTDSGEGNYDIVGNPRDSHSGGESFTDHTSGAGLMLVANGAADTNQVVWRQSVAVSTNTTYEFTGWAASWSKDSDPNPPRFQVRINGRAVGSAFQLSSQSAQWQSFSTRWSSRTSVVAVIELRLETAEGFGNDPAFDDLQFTIFLPRTTIRVASVEICWPSVSGAMYQVEYESEVTGHIWTALGAVVEGTGTTNCVIDAVTMPRRLYRVRDVP
ncbi:MAG: hypothetical protein L0Y58_01470 [Verrucomicrobia subdivision 3 bacterium]|nr:hypothetical protein [Limisphaerales bacterium]